MLLQACSHVQQIIIILRKEMCIDVITQNNLPNNPENNFFEFVEG